jgi:phage terminase large subunit
VSRRKRVEITSPFDAVLEDLGELAQTSLVAYREDPVCYARERLGVQLLPHQAAVAYSFAGQWDRITPEMTDLAELRNPGHRKIAVSSGTKTGKSLLVVVLALWFYECFPDARAFITAAKGDQIRTVIWVELANVLRKAKLPPAGRLSEDPSRGMIAPDKSREIRGFTGRKVEALAGISGNLGFFVDEASFLEQDKYEAVSGNRASEGSLGAPLLFTSNPTRTDGPFFDAFHTLKDTWTTAHFDSERIAEYVVRNRVRNTYIATLARIEDWKREWGEDSPFYLIRVKGRFVRDEAGRIHSLHSIEAAQARWNEEPDDGVLSIGLDPAGPGVGGDETAFAFVRSRKCLSVMTFRGLTEDGIIANLRGFIASMRRADEVPQVTVDVDGLGSDLFARLVAIAAELARTSPHESFRVFACKPSAPAKRQPARYERVRDELEANLVDWMREGAIPPSDARLEAELYAPMWEPRISGKMKVTDKEDLRAKLKRSPDRANALGLAVWFPVVEIEEAVDATAPASTEVPSSRGFDPYEFARLSRMGK